ncbi:hypothetical protein ACJBU6_09769 [Exserohilum turcicum]
MLVHVSLSAAALQFFPFCPPRRGHSHSPSLLLYHTHTSQTTTMRSFYQVAVLALPLLSLARAAEVKKQAELQKPIYASAQEAFQDLLNALPEESLHAALSGLKDFKNGVFESYHRGVEHVHHNNPELATKLIVDAVNDLKKRQTPSNGTLPATDSSAPASTPTPTPTPTPSQNSPPPAQSSSPAPSPGTSQPPPDTVTETQTKDKTTTTQQTTTQTTTQRPAIIPVVATVTKDGTTIVQTTEVLSQVTASVAVTVVQTNSQGKTITTTENKPAVIKTTTDKDGRTTVTTSAANYAPTAGQVQTTTNQQGSVFVTTYTPGGGLVSSIKLITTTDAQGQQSTLTSYEFVDPVQPTATSNNDRPTGSRPDGPSLQTGAAVKNQVQYAALGLGAMALFF